MSASSTSVARMLGPLPIPAYLWDRRTERFVGWNAPMLALLGYTDEELRNLDWHDLVVPEEITVAERAIEKGPLMEAVRWHWRTKDGQIVEVTLAMREAFFLNDEKEVRDVYVGLVLAVGTAAATPAPEAF